MGQTNFSDEFLTNLFPLHQIIDKISMLTQVQNLLRISKLYEPILVCEYIYSFQQLHICPLVNPSYILPPPP